MAAPDEFRHNELIEISRGLLNTSAGEVTISLGIQEGRVLSRADFDRFTAEIRRVYNLKRQEFTDKHPGHVLPDLMQDVQMRPANANANLTRHIKSRYNEVRKHISGLPDEIPDTLPYFPGNGIIQEALLFRSMEGPPAAAAAGAADAAAAANPGLRRRALHIESSQANQREQSRQLFNANRQEQLRRGETVEQRAQRELLERVVMNADAAAYRAEQMANAQMQHQAFQANAGETMVRNSAIVASRAARQARIAHEISLKLQQGQTVMTGLQHTALTRIGDLHTLTGNVLQGVNETLGLSRDIHGAVGRIESGVMDLRRMWNTDRVTLFRLAAHNEFIMFAVFFMTGAQLPFLTQSISAYWFAYIAATRLNSQVRGLMRGEYNTLIGGTVTLVTPWIVTSTFFTYNDQMSQARVLNDPAYSAAFSSTAETAICAMLRNPREMLSNLRRTGPEITMPTIEQIQRTLLGAFESAGATGRSILDTLARIDPNWSDPARFIRVLAQYLLGQLTVAMNGASVLLGSRAFVYQGFVLRGAFLSIWQLIMTYILEFLWDIVKWAVGTIFKGVADVLCNLWPEVELPGIWGKTKLGGHSACMTAFGFGKEKQEGGTLQQSALVQYSSEAEKIDKQIDRIMWTSFLLEINASIHPHYSQVNTKILKELYTIGGSLYLLTLVPELGISYESRKFPLLFPKYTNKLLKNKSPYKFLLKDKSKTRHRRSHRTKTKRN
jgi:hypothetical protein